MKLRDFGVFLGGLVVGGFAVRTYYDYKIDQIIGTAQEELRDYYREVQDEKNIELSEVDKIFDKVVEEANKPKVKAIIADFDKKPDIPYTNYGGHNLPTDEELRNIDKEATVQVDREDIFVITQEEFEEDNHMDKQTAEYDVLQCELYDPNGEIERDLTGIIGFVDIDAVFEDPAVNEVYIRNYPLDMDIEILRRG